MPAVPMALFQSADPRKRIRVSASASSSSAPLLLTPVMVIQLVPPSTVYCHVPLPLRPVTAMPRKVSCGSVIWPAMRSLTRPPARCPAVAHGGGLPCVEPVQTASSNKVITKLAPLSTGARLTITFTSNVAVSLPPLSTPPLSFTAKEKDAVPRLPTAEDLNFMPWIWASV
jgi:hypothetical protein